jgi:hypothetical protein
MMYFRHRVIFACLAGLVAAPLAAALALAQERPVVAVRFQGTEAFGHFLHSFGLEPVSRIEDAGQLPPEKTLLVVFGKLELLPKSRLDVEKFRKRGGAVLLACDYPVQLDVPPGKLTVLDTMVLAGEKSRYKGKWAECPVVAHFPVADHPLFKDLKNLGLATNSPALLEIDPFPGGDKNLRLLATFPDDCAYRLRHGGGPGVPAARGYLVGSPKDALPAGRMVVLAGQGLFLNGMLIQPDNDNFAFTWNLIGWLAEGPKGPREHAVFIDQGQVVDQFALPLSKFGAVPIPPIQVINRMIRGLEDENVLNRMLIENVGKEPLLRGLLVLASLVVLILGARRIMQGRFRLDVRVPLIVSKGPAAPPALPVLVERQEELRRQGNLWEPAQVLVRRFFLDHAGLTVPLWDDDGAAPPPLEAHGSFWQRRTLTRQVLWLWNLARSGPGQPVSPRQFDDLLQTLNEVTAAALDGRLRLGGAA